MKKSLVLAMAMALGVTASAYAANPFSDVPAGHWAYDSISKLAAAGVVEGYPDGSFKGDNLMTRYEMAQIVAKAMAKGANVDALAAEFADELDNLGVRVAALEKKADNVKITGQIRYNYAKVTSGKHDSDNLRSRITIAGQINEDWTYTAMLQNEEKFMHEDAAAKGGKDKFAKEGTEWQRAYLDGKVGGLKVRAGRYNFAAATATQFMPFDSAIYGNRIDGITAKYGKAIRLAATAGKMTASADINKFWAFEAAGDLGKAATLNAGWYNLNGTTAAKDAELLNIGLKVKLGKNLTVAGDWIKAEDGPNDGNEAWIAGVQYKGASAAKPGSFGISAQYVNIEKGTTYADAWNATTVNNKTDLDGEGIALGAYYTIAKNIVAGVEYYNIDEKAHAGNTETLWSQIIFTF